MLVGFEQGSVVIGATPPPNATRTKAQSWAFVFQCLLLLFGWYARPFLRFRFRRRERATTHPAGEIVFAQAPRYCVCVSW